MVFLNKNDDPSAFNLQFGAVVSEWLDYANDY